MSSDNQKTQKEPSAEPGFFEKLFSEFSAFLSKPSYQNLKKNKRLQRLAERLHIRKSAPEKPTEEKPGNENTPSS